MVSQPHSGLRAVAHTRASIEAWIIAKLAELLGADESCVRKEHTFADCGLDSVMLACLAGELELYAGVPIGVQTVLEYPTIALLAAHVISCLPAEELSDVS